MVQPITQPLAAKSPDEAKQATPHTLAVHTRDGFAGDVCAVLRPYPTHEYIEVDGPHAPHRLDLASLDLADRNDPSALPVAFLAGRGGLSLSASALAAPTPYAWRNAEHDEMHFVQEGTLDYVTDFGTLRAEPGDFIYLGRAATYRVMPLTTPTLRLIVETPQRIRIATLEPFGVVDADRDVHRPDPARVSTCSGQTRLLVKSFDGITRYLLPRDPLALSAHLGGQAPVWKLNLTRIGRISFGAGVPGAPAQFAETSTRDTIFFTMSSRKNPRPPLHHNADYDEIELYFRGPGARGVIDQPGTLTWVPKGVAHWGPEEDVPEGNWAWLLESRDTLRLTQSGLAAAQRMETGHWGLHK